MLLNEINTILLLCKHEDKITVYKHVCGQGDKIPMDFSSIYTSLKRALDSDPEFIAIFGYENSEDDAKELFDCGDGDEGDDEFDCSQIKRARLDQSLISVDSAKKVIFLVDEKEFRRVQQRSHSLLEELFALTLNWPAGKLLKLLSNHDLAHKAIKYNFCFRNSVFDAPLSNIPVDTKSPVARIPRMIVLLMSSLARPESLKTIGAFRVEVSNTRCDYYQELIDSKFDKINEINEIQLDEIPIIGKMTVLKRYFRKIPGFLVDRIITELFFELFVAYEASQCFSEVISLILNCLPLENYKALAMICLLLKLYSEHWTDTLMSDENLAIIWAPNLFDLPGGMEEGDRKVTPVIIKLLNLFIKRWDKFFICKL